ncbi:MAG TPA: TolC family protein, partial [Rhodoferax sp.]
MQHVLRAGAIVAVLVMAVPAGVLASEAVPGASLQTLLELAQASNPEYASMRFEAQAATERVKPAGALMDPKFRIEWMDVTKMGEQNPTLWPSDVGSTKYTLMQDIPWFGKRDLKRDIAHFEAEGSLGKALGTWLELAARIKTLQAQRYYLRGNKELTQEILDLMARLEQVAQSRYAGGLAAQQDVIRAQVEQTNMRNELVMIESESLQVDARLNALLARPAMAALAAPESLRPLPAQALLDAAKLEE